MTAPAPQSQPDIVERLRSSEPLPACPFDKISPLYLTMPADKPCPFCGQENTLEGPDKCRGADTRIFGEAADAIAALKTQVEDLTSDYLRRHKDACDKWEALKLAEYALTKDSLCDSERIAGALATIRRALEMPLEDRK